MLDYPAGIVPDLIRIFRHKKAIPQYESSSADRFAAINELQKQYPGLVVAGNLKGGIGMADRIKRILKSPEKDELSLSSGIYIYNSQKE